MSRRFSRLGELPETLYRERQPGLMHDPNAGLALDWSNRYRTTNFFFLAQTTSTPILQENHLRCYLMVQNLDPANDLHIAFNSDAIFNTSPVIIPRGNAEFIGGEAGGSFVPKASISVISSIANHRVAVVEGTLEPYNVQDRV